MRNVPRFVILFIIIFISIILNCKKEEDEENDPVISPPVGVVTRPVTAISSYEAIVNGLVSGTGGSEKMYQDFCWSTMPDPDTSSLGWGSHRWDIEIKEAHGQPGPFQSMLHDLLPNTTYYIRAFALNEAGITYGNPVYFNTLPDITDIDGNNYGIANIGSQTWMTKDLRTTCYNDGEPIPVAGDFMEWRTLSGPGIYLDTIISPSPWGWIDTIARGPYYNWQAINAGRLCPEGWHVPTDAEWLLLALYVGKDVLCSNQRTDYEGTNADAWFFGAQYSMIIDTAGHFIGDSGTSIWWSSSPTGNFHAWTFILDPENLRQKFSMRYGLNVRCLKDW